MIALLVYVFWSGCVEGLDLFHIAVVFSVSFMACRELAPLELLY